MGIDADAKFFYGYVWRQEERFSDEVADYAWDHKDSPIEVGYYGADSYAIPYIAIKETHHWASTGDAVQVPLESFVFATKVSDFGRKEGWNTLLKEFAAEHNLDLEQKDEYDGKPLVKGPDWFLVSYMG